MPRFYRAVSTTEIAPGTGKTVTLGGKTIALFNVNGAFHALDNVCPHRAGPLGEGRLDGKVVSCPWHGWTFDVTTGVCRMVPTVRATIYATRIKNGFVFVRI